MGGNHRGLFGDSSDDEFRRGERGGRPGQAAYGQPIGDGYGNYGNQFPGQGI